MDKSDGADPLADLGRAGAHEVAVGHALISIVEPRPGFEREYNRWYEDDHFFAGALFEPWIFAGRRWVATRDLQQMRYLASDPELSAPLAAGCYLTTFWVATGRLAESQRWNNATNERLEELGRIFPHRDHVFTSFQDKFATVYRDEHVPRDVFSLMDPAPGIVVEILDARTADDRTALEEWLIHEHLPRRLSAGAAASSAMVFRTNGPDEGMRPQVRERLLAVANGGRRLTVLWFLDQDPRTRSHQDFADEAASVAESGRGSVTMIAPFIPARMGTDEYADELR